MVAHRSQKPESLKVTSTEGLEGLFHGDGGVAEGLLDPGCRVEEKGLTLKEACRYFGLSSTSIRLKLKLGEIAGIKRDGPNGPEWRIYPDGLPEGLECSAQADLDDHPESTVVSEYNQGVVTVEPGSYDPGYQEILGINRRLCQDLEAAVFRIGYLQAQLDAQIKLLPDLERRAERAKQIELEAESLRERVKQLENERESSRAPWWKWWLGQSK